jgi:hypothetical protein
VIAFRPVAITAMRSIVFLDPYGFLEDDGCTGGYGRAGSGGDAYEVKTDDRSGSKLLIFVRPKRHDFPRDIYRSGEFSCAPEADRLKQRSMIMAEGFTDSLTHQ